MVLLPKVLLLQLALVRPTIGMVPVERKHELVKQASVFRRSLMIEGKEPGAFNWHLLRLLQKKIMLPQEVFCFFTPP